MFLESYILLQLFHRDDVKMGIESKTVYASSLQPLVHRVVMFYSSKRFWNHWPSVLVINAGHMGWYAEQMLVLDKKKKKPKAENYNSPVYSGLWNGIV